MVPSCQDERMTHISEKEWNPLSAARLAYLTVECYVKIVVSHSKGLLWVAI